MSPETLEKQPQKQRRIPSCLLFGCGLLAFGGLLLVLLAWWSYGHVREWAAAGAYEAVSATIAEAQLEPAQRSAILADLARLRDGFASGEVSLKQAQQFFESLSSGPFLPVAAVIATDRLVLEPSDLSPEEKLEGRIHLERIARGLHEGSIANKEALALLETIDQDPAQDDYNFERKPTLEEVRALIAKTKALADEREIPVETFDVDLAAEVHQAVDSAFE